MQDYESHEESSFEEEESSFEEESYEEDAGSSNDFMDPVPNDYFDDSSVRDDYWDKNG